MNFFIKTISLIAVACLTANAYAASYWKDEDQLALRQDLPIVAKASNARFLQANIQFIREQLLSHDQIDIELPLPNGSAAIYHFEYSPIAEQGLLDKFPEIRTFRGVDVNNSANRGRFDISPAGFRGMFRHNGETIFIDPQYIGNSELYISYRARDAQSLSAVAPAEHVELRSLIGKPLVFERNLPKGSSDGNLRTYRLAVAATGEYTAVFSDIADPIATKRALALAAIVTAVNRVNEVFEVDLGISFNLVANNDQIIYVDETTDTYANDGSIADLSRNQINIDTVVGSANYDIGHLFGTGSGGVASLGSVCDDNIKARGLTGLDDPTGDAFYIDFVAHEIGHQFGANHTFNGTTGSCGGANRNATTAYEPGSGSTIMAYASICGAENLPDPSNPDSDQANSDPYFHAGSIAEITRYVTTGFVSLGGALVAGEGNTCGVVTAPANNVPDADAEADFTIPANTPIYLSGSASDDDTGDTLTYVWEQLDAGASSSSVAEWIDNGDRAIFRSLLPTASGVRYLPNLGDLVESDLDNGESIPTTNRNLNFRLTVRDGNGGTAYENKVLTVTTSAGPFNVLTPEDDDVWTQGTTVVTWDVAGTNVAPVSCENVNIYYDGSITGRDDIDVNSFSTVLASDTPNDGSHLVTTPVTPSVNAWVLVRCADTEGAFFSLSESAFEVSASTNPIVSSVSNNSASEGDPVTFSIVMSAVPVVDEIVNFELSTGTASFGDFGSAVFSSGVVDNNDGTLTVPSGVVVFEAVVPTVEDDVVEPDETFILSVGSASGIGTIIDDDTVSSGSGNSDGGFGEGSSGGSTGTFILLLMSLLLAASRKKRAW